MILAFTISWIIWAPLLLPTNLSGRLQWLLYYAGVSGPAAAAFVMARIGTVVRRETLVQRLLRWRVGVIWYAVALLLPFAVRCAALVATTLIYRGGLSWPTFRPAAAVVQVVILLILLVPFEEIGWRGYALPVLQRRHALLTASLVVAVIWALWHFPLAYASVGYQQTDRPLTYMLRFTMTIIPISCLATWLFNRTGGSVAVVSLFHVAVNVADYLVVLPEALGEVVLWGVTVLNAVVVAVIW